MAASKRQLHAYLMASIDRIMAMGGNYVRNIGPDAEGRFPDPAVETLEAVGNWYGSVKEALIAKPFVPNPKVSRPYLMTRNANTLYLHFPQPPEASGFFIEDLVRMPLKASAE